MTIYEAPTQYEILDSNGTIVGCVWAHSVKRQDEETKAVWLCDQDGSYIASAWYGCRKHGVTA